MSNGHASRSNAQRVDDDHPLAKLLTRLTRPYLQATEKVESGYDQALLFAGAKPWTAPLPLMTVMHGFWLVAIQRLMIQEYITAAIKMLPDKKQVPPEVLAFIEKFMDRVDELELATVRLESQNERGMRFPQSSKVELPKFLSTPGLSYAVWSAYAALQGQLMLDQDRVAKLGVPKHMKEIQDAFKDRLVPDFKQFDYVRARVTNSPTIDEYDQAIRDVRPLAESFFSAGQELWAPYLLGTSYRDALRYKPMLDDLEFGFDVWCLTDPKEVEKRKADATSRQQLFDFWKSLKQPVAAAQLQTQLDEAVKNRRIRRRTGQQYKLVPWQSLYLVRFPIEFGGRAFKPGDLITFFSKETPSGCEAEVRRTGNLSHPFDLLGQRNN